MVRCENCHYYEYRRKHKTKDIDIGVCHRHPDPFTVTSGYWCGEYKPKTLKK